MKFSSLLTSIQSHLEQMLDEIRTLVECESPSLDKPLCDALASRLARDFEALGGTVTRHRVSNSGDHLQIDFASAANRKPVLLIGHYDTVWPAGTLVSMPWKRDSKRIYGPGVYDMKTSIVMMQHAIRALRKREGEVPRPVTIMLVSDEEVGSESSRKITESLAKKCAAVLVLEPSQGLEGALKTARKGVGDYTVRVTGISSHAGVDFAAGHSAVLELAHQVEKIASFTNLKSGVTVNPGVIHGGTRTNVVAASAEVECDIRIEKMSQFKALDKKFRSLKPFDKKCELEVSGGLNRPPMERTTEIAALFKLAQGIARELGFKVEERATGGGSDGNFTAALGIPTLDGLGPVGEGAHAKHESVLIHSIPQRIALVAELIARI